MILGFLSIFRKSEASSPFEALNTECLSRCQRVVRSPVQMSQRPTFSPGSPQGIQTCLHLVRYKMTLNFSHCREIRDSWGRASRGPFHLRQKTQGPSHTPIAEGKLRLRCLWKVGSPLKSKTGNQLSSWDDMGFMELSSSCCTEINIHIDLRRLSQRISVVCYRKSSNLFCMLWNT